MLTTITSDQVENVISLTEWIYETTNTRAPDESSRDAREMVDDSQRRELKLLRGAPKTPVLTITLLRVFTLELCPWGHSSEVFCWPRF